MGIIGGAVPGPIITSVFTEVLNTGFLKSLKIISRAVFAESLVALAILVVFYSLNLSQLYFHIISLGGVLVLIWLAWQVWRIDQFKNETGEIFSLPKIFLLTILNGGFWLFWITISVPRALELGQNIKGGQYLFLLIFELGWILTTVLLAFIFSRFRPILQKKNLVSVAFKIFSALLILFAIRSLVGSIKFLLNI